MLTICQVKGEWQTKDEKLKLYQNYLVKLVDEFEEIKFNHIGRDRNYFVDALPKLASITQIINGEKIQPVNIEVWNLQACCSTVKES